MKKKLFAILLSVFIFLGLFANTLHADLTVVDILPDDFPNISLDSFSYGDCWVNENCVYVYSVNGREHLNFLIASDSAWYFSTGSISKIEDDYEATLTLGSSLNDINLRFIMDDDGNYFESIVISNADNEIINGTYKPSAKCLTTDSLPLETSSNYWRNANDDVLYLANYEGDYYLHFENSDGSIAFEGSYFNVADLPLHKVSDSVYTFKDNIYTDDITNEIMSLTFNFDDDVLKDVECSFTGDYAVFNGTYKAPITIANVLASSSDLFPTDPKKGWVNTAGKKVTSGFGNLIFDGSYAVPLSSAVIKNPDGNYQFVNGDVTYTFFMESNVLVKININGTGDADKDGDYEPYRFINPYRTINAGSSDDLEFITNGKYVDQFTTAVTVTVDNQLLDQAYYTVASNPTHVFLKGNYVKNIAPGVHTIIINMTGYSDISTQFTITDSPQNPTKRFVIPVTGIGCIINH